MKADARRDALVLSISSRNLQTYRYLLAPTLPVWPGMVRLLRYLQTVRGARVRPHGGSSYSARAPGRMRKRGVRRTCVLCVPGPSYHALITSPAQMRRAQPPSPPPHPHHLTFPRYRRPTSSYDFIVTALHPDDFSSGVYRSTRYVGSARFTTNSDDRHGEILTPRTDT